MAYENVEVSTVTTKFEKIATLLASNKIYNSVAELHGIISGQLGAGGNVGDVILTWHLLGQESKISKIMNDLILRLHDEVKQDLSADDFTFQLLLPDDDEELAIRTNAIGNWCEGFISGFGGAYAKSDASLLEETREVLKDFTAIASIDDSLEETEEDEQHYMEVVEYVRMAVCTVYSQNNSHQKNSQVIDDNLENHH